MHHAGNLLVSCIKHSLNEGNGGTAALSQYPSRIVIDGRTDFLSKTEDARLVVDLLSRLTRRAAIVGNQLLPQITYRQWHMLWLLLRMPGQTSTVSQLAEATMTSHQNVKVMLGALQKSGFVTMARSDEDARVIDVNVTEKTRDYFEMTEGIVDTATDEIFSQFSDAEVTDLIEKLSRLLGYFNDYESKHLG